MLMPSALPCDSSQSQSSPGVPRLRSPLFHSPPASPEPTTPTTFGSLRTTCRALHSMITTPAATATSAQPPQQQQQGSGQLLSPPMANATLPPSNMKLRLRSAAKTNAQNSANAGGEQPPARKRIVKRSAPPRGLNKRRRVVEDDASRDNDIDIDSDLDLAAAEGDSQAAADLMAVATPRRARLAPEQLPLGLDRSDFHNLHDGSSEDEMAATMTTHQAEGSDVEVEADGEAWSTEDDRVLVELIIEKLKLTKSDWQDCARSLGKDRGSVGRRWKTLMVNGDVGLKPKSSRRPKIHGTWW